MRGTPATVPQVSTVSDADTFSINVGGKQRQVSKSDLESQLDVTSNVIVAGIVNDTSTAYTPTSSDVSKWVRLDNASAITVTIQAASSGGFSTGNVLMFYQLGVGAITVAAGAGVTLNGTLSTAATGQGIACVNVGNDVWDVVGAI